MEDRMKICKRLLELISKGTKQSLSHARKSLANQPAEVIELFLSSSGCEKLFAVLMKTPFGLDSANELEHVEVQIEGLRAVKTVMRTSVGLEFMATCRQAPAFFTSMIENGNDAIRKHIYDLMSALLVYSDAGYKNAIKTLNTYQLNRKEESKLAFVVRDLAKTSTASTLKSAALTYINCLVISTESLWDRIQIRDELKNLGLEQAMSAHLSLTSEVKSSAKQQEVDDSSVLQDEIIIQNSIYEDQRVQDDQLMLEHIGFDIKDLHHLIDKLLKKLRESDQSQLTEMKLLHVLQNIFLSHHRERPQSATNKKLWQQLEISTKRNLRPMQPMMDNSMESTSGHDLFYSTSPWSEPNNLSLYCSAISTAPTHMPHNEVIGTCCQCKCHFETDPLTMTVAFHPPDDVTQDSLHNYENPASSELSAVPEFVPMALSKAIEVNEKVDPEIIQEDEFDNLKMPVIPKPSTKMRSINWQKLPKSAIFTEKSNLWKNILMKEAGKQKNTVDFVVLEEYFKQKDSPDDKTDGSVEESQNVVVVNEKPIRILDERKSLSLNVLIRQFRCSHSEILGKIRRGESSKIGVERLRSLKKLLPTNLELEMLRNYTGDKNKLDEAEKFLKLLVSLPHFDLRLESMLLKETFSEKVNAIDPAISAMKKAADEIRDNPMLCEVLSFMLTMGNFLNDGGYAGNAVGVRLSSVNNVLENKTNQCQKLMRHVLAEELVKQNDQIRFIRSTLPSVHRASRESLEGLADEVIQTTNNINSVLTKISTTTSFVREQFTSDLEIMKSGCSLWSAEIEKLKKIEWDMREYFCETPSTAEDKMPKLEMIYMDVDILVEKVEISIKEIDEMNAQEEQRRLRKSRSFNASIQLLNESNSSSCSDASTSNKSFERTLMRTKHGLRPSRRKFAGSMKYSATFAHSPMSYFHDPGDASSEGGSSPILLQRKTVKQQLNAKIDEQFNMGLNEIKNTRRDQLRRAKERRKREVEILSQANLKKISDSQADIDFLAFANPNAHVPDNSSTVNFTVDNTMKQSHHSISQTSSAATVTLTTPDERTQRRMRRQEVYSAPEAGTLQHPSKQTSTPNNNGAFGFPSPKQQLESSPTFCNIALPSNQSEIHKSQHSVEDYRSNSSINDNFEMLMRHNANIEHNGRLETSNTSSDALSDDSSEISSEETTVIEACRNKLCSISENSNVATDEEK